MRWLPTLFCVLGLAVAPDAAPADALPDERNAAYLQFRSAFDAGDFAAALPLASRVVDMTRSQYGADSPELANPLSNLATTYLRMREFGLALDTYRQALTLLDLQGDATDPKLVRPLHGMGAALRGLDRSEEAIAVLKRAVDITRNRDGLFAAGQLLILSPLIDSYMATGRFEDAGREQQYAYTVAEAAYGKDDLRLLGPLDSYGRWNETVGRFTAARLLHARAVQLADAAAPNSVKAVDGLRGIARSYRLAFLHGETEEAAAEANSLPTTLGNSAITRVISAPSTEGERALRNALQRLEGGGTVAALRGEVLIDLGDWYLTAGAENRALASYREAWPELVAGGNTRLLATPVAVVYRPPNMAVSRGTEDADVFDVRDVEVRLSIAATGAVRDAIVSNPAPASEAAERALILAVKRASWRPAFSNGEPVAVTDHVLHERLYVRRPNPAP
jgi:tetratricopeptide (TPR) repeat protein